MDAHALYPVCPHRNVPAAFERFHGPDAGGVERFFIDDLTRLRDLFDAMASACERFEQRAAMCGPALQALLLLIWGAACLYAARFARGVSDWAVHPQMPLLLVPQATRGLRALAIAREVLPRAGRMVTTFGRSYRARIARAWNDGAGHPQLPLLLGLQPAPAFLV